MDSNNAQNNTNNNMNEDLDDDLIREGEFTDSSDSESTEEEMLDEHEFVDSDDMADIEARVNSSSSKSGEKSSNSSSSNTKKSDKKVYIPGQKMPKGTVLEADESAYIMRHEFGLDTFPAYSFDYIGEMNFLIRQTLLWESETCTGLFYSDDEKRPETGQNKALNFNFTPLFETPVGPWKDQLGLHRVPKFTFPYHDPSWLSGQRLSHDHLFCLWHLSWTLP